MKPEWTNGFFTGLWVEFQRKLWPAEKSRADADLALGFLRLLGPTSILDIPCGDGRVSLELARRGHIVTGVDLCPEFISEARERAELEKLKADFNWMDMFELEMDPVFGAAICLWGSMGYKSERDDLKLLRAIRKALKPGGVFLLEAATIESLFTNFQETGWRKAGDIHALERRAWRAETSRIECEWTLLGGGKVESKFSSIRVYSYREIVGMLFDAGFEGVKSYNSAGEESRDHRELSLFFKARRPGA